ncbi:MAG: DUF4423 domain-containing protein [Bacteriovoracaceae bacterium]
MNILTEGQDSIREKLKLYLEEIKKRNPSYSLRALAVKLDINAGGLSSFLNRKKDFSPELIEKLVSQIIENPEERKDILNSYNESLIEKIKSKAQTSHYEYVVLQNDELEVIKNPLHYALLSLIETRDFHFDLLWISKKLDIEVTELEQMVNRLIKLKLVELTANNRLLRTVKRIKTSDDQLSNALQTMHEQMLDHSKKSLKSNNVIERDITSLTLPVNIDNLPKAKELIRKLQDDLMAILEDGEKTEVYQLLVCLTPVTKKSV